MASPHEIPANPEIAVPDYRQILADAYYERPDRPEMPDIYFDAMAVALEAGHRHYGSSSQNALPKYHIADHFLGVTTGSWRWLDYMKDELDFDVSMKDYAVGGLIGPLHDLIRKASSSGIVHQDSYTIDFGEFNLTVTDDGSETDEALSAKMAVLFLNKLGLQNEIKRRVGRGVLLTEVVFTEDGNVIQTRVGKGGRDYGAIAAAIADTKNVFGEDEGAIVEDIIRLAIEIAGEDADSAAIMSEIDKLLKAEPIFIKQKLEEARDHLLGTEGDPVEKDNLRETLERKLAPHVKRALGIAACFDPKSENLRQIRETIQDRIDRLVRQKHHSD